MMATYTPGFPGNECSDPVSSATSAITDTMSQADAAITQILSGVAAAAVGTVSFKADASAPLPWGTDPTPTPVFVNGRPRFPVTQVDPAYEISIAGSVIRPYLDFDPTDPKEGAFASVSTQPSGLHFRAAFPLPVVGGQVTAATRTFTWTQDPFNPSMVGMQILCAEQAGSPFTITAVVDSGTVICGNATTLTDASELDGDLINPVFTGDDVGRTITITSSPLDQNDGQYVISSVVSPSELILRLFSPDLVEDRHGWSDSVSTHTLSTGAVHVMDAVATTDAVIAQVSGAYSWTVSYSLIDLLNLINTSPALANNPSITTSVNTGDLSIQIAASKAGSLGNNLSIQIGSSLTFISISGSVLTGGKDGGLTNDMNTAGAVAGAVFGVADAALQQGGSSIAGYTLTTNIIPPSVYTDPAELATRLSLCGYNSVGGLPMITGANPAPFGGYVNATNLCGFDAIRSFLADGSPGDVLIVSIAVQDVAVLDSTSCGPDAPTYPAEVPFCGMGPRAVPNAVRFVIIHHTVIQISPSGIAALKAAGFNEVQIASILSNSSENGITSIVIGVPNAIEGALSNGYSLDDVQGVLNQGIEDWQYDATRDQLRAQVMKLTTGASTAAQQQCLMPFLAGLDADKLSGADDNMHQTNTNLCGILDEKLKAGVQFLLDAIKALNSTIGKVQAGINPLLSQALSLNSVVNSLLKGFPGAADLACLTGAAAASLPGISASLPSIPGVDFGGGSGIGGSLGGGLGGAANAAVNAAGLSIKSCIARIGSVFQIAQGMHCTLQGALSSLISTGIGSNPALQCLASSPNLTPNLPSLGLPQCALDMLGEVQSALDQVATALTLSLNLCLNVSGIANTLASMVVVAGSVGSTSAGSSAGGCSPAGAQALTSALLG